MKSLPRSLVVVASLGIGAAGGFWLAAGRGAQAVSAVQADEAAELDDARRNREMLAARTVDRVHVLRAGSGSPSLALGGEELTALLQHTLPGLLPSGVEAPRVDVSAGRVRVRVRVVSAEWDGADRLRTVLSILPDTIVGELEGDVVRRGSLGVFRVRTGRANGFELPGALVAGLVRALPTGAGPLDTGAAGGWGAAEVATLRLRLPDGISDVEVVGDRLVLHAVEPIVERAVDGDRDP